MSYKQKNNRGYLLIEVVAALTVLGIMLGVFSQLLSSSSNASKRLIARQKCIAAALAQLDSLDYTGQMLSAEQIDLLWPNVQVELEQSVDTEPYRGFVKYTATARLTLGSNEISSRQVRYMPGNSDTGRTKDEM